VIETHRFSWAPSASPREQTHLAIIHHRGLDQQLPLLPILHIRQTVIMLITDSDCQLASIGRESQCRDLVGVLGELLHPLLGGVVPYGDEAV
jgi:hypothetical protein